MNATPQFIGALTEMVWEQIGTYTSLSFCFSSTYSSRGSANVAIDLESFSRHAGRTTVTTDDVLLVTRRNDALYGIVKDFIDKEKTKNGAVAAKGKRRRKN